MKKLSTVLPVLLLSNLLCMMDVSIMTIVLPELQTAFKISLDDLSWALNIYTILFATLIIPLGRLAARWGRNRFVLMGLLCFALGSWLTGAADNLTWLLIGRAIQSVGAASIIPTSMVIGLELSDSQNRNKVVALLAGTQGLAVALGPTIGGVVAQYWSWRWVFWLNVPLIVIDVVAFALVLPLRNEKRYPNKIDWLGAVLSMVTLFSLSLALVKGNSWGWQSRVIIGTLILACLALAGFIWRELQATSPMIDPSLFSSRNFNGAGLALVLGNFFLGSLAALIPTWLTKVHGESELTAALQITPYSLTVMVTVIMGALLVGKISSKLLIGGGFALIVISFGFLSRLPLANDYTALYIGEVLLGAGFGIVAATANVLAVADFHGTKLTDSQSVANVFRQVGMVLAIAIFMTVLTNNLQQARMNTLRYGQQVVNRLDISASTKRTVKSKLTTKLSANTTTNVNQQVSFSGVKVTPAKRQQLINQAVAVKLAALAKVQAVPVNQLPRSLQTAVQQKVAAKVNVVINKKIAKMNATLASGINQIHRHLMRQLNQAFQRTFAFGLPLALLAIGTSVIFKKQA